MKGLVAWFADNPVAANLLMAVILIGGLIGVDTVEKEVFPSQETKIINVGMSYLGAGPREVEQQIVVRIEEAIADLVGIFQISSTATQGYGNVRIEVIEGYDVKEVLNDIKARVDAINTFPSSVERPIISQNINRVPLMFFTLYGDVDDAIMKATAQQIADDMALLNGISQVTYRGTKDDQMNIEISEYNLRRFNLTFDQVATAIRNSSLNLPAGNIKTRLGNVQVQTRSQAYNADDFANITIISYADGTQLKLGDIANIRDGFADVDLEVGFNGVKAIDFQAMISDQPDLFGGTQSARDYIEKARKVLPAGLKIDINYEMRQLFDSRLNLLTGNAIGGLLLVFIILMLFLRPILAIWVCVGIATSFAGALWLLPYSDISVNMISMFAFLMVLGIVVDDAIVVGESVYSQQQKGNLGVPGSAEGAKRVFKPVVLAVLSTIIFFFPMIDVPMEVKPHTHSIFFVVVFCLLFSLIECLLILPSHLSHMKPERPSRFLFLQKVTQIRIWFSGKLNQFAQQVYQPQLVKCLNNAGATTVGFLMAVLLAISVFVGGWMNVSFFPQVPQSFIIANVNLPEGSAYNEALRIANHISQVAEDMRTDESLLNANKQQPFLTEIKKTASGNNANVFVGLQLSESRTVSAKQVTERFKQLIGPIPEAKQYSLAFSFGGSSSDISLNLNITSNDLQDQQAASQQVVKTLSAYPGISNVRSSLESARVEVELALKPHAETLGITLNQIARQVRQGFYGEEVQRIPRGKEDVRVMLNYPKEHRTELDLLNNMRIRTNAGVEIPLEEVADIQLVPGYTKIDRVDRKRNIQISADIADGYDAMQTVNQMLNDNLQTWQRQIVGFDLKTEGNLRAQATFQSTMAINFIMALLAVYVLMAVAFKSYSEPFLILTAVPFGFVGAILGHTIMGHDISMMSFLGFLACAGVVVNDNLVLLDRVNQLRDNGANAIEAVLQAGQDRFRAIVLTSLTTFVGLMPILFEKSGQAQFLIPMVISLGFGVLLASTVTLILVPCIYVLFDKVKNRVKQVLKINSGIGSRSQLNELEMD
ncbi:AcrB/AcrD/AcrF family protein [Saccharobesus litoralis]|uniref:AcrB/AcrD/AcrF family protein n=1 Tax=Saccharobesus litoralis TaxID=2172099 RepID=A0A2S0VW02_9ALTE|nr:efflux RND transporter permease subunit [Saccharobesus litoralis]AWB68399.1 AcrB/AcrD/AcrF family protein [Saccharobesus litoralis]